MNALLKIAGMKGRRPRGAKRSTGKKLRGQAAEIADEIGTAYANEELGKRFSRMGSPPPPKKPFYNMSVIYPPSPRRNTSSNKRNLAIGVAVGATAVGAGIAYKAYRDKKRREPLQYELDQ